jgi:putative ABC transport system permease protein
MNPVFEMAPLFAREAQPAPAKPARARERRRMHPGEMIVDLAVQTFANLRRNKLRSFLTLFGIAWGIASLVLMSALSDGFRQGQRKNMSQIGDNIVFAFGGITEMQAGGQRAGRRIFLDSGDLEAIRAQCPLVETVSGEQKNFNVALRSEFNSGRFATVGVDPAYLRLRNLPVGEGRAISAEDVGGMRRVAVLGSRVRQQLFQKQPRALGQRVFINNYPYEVVGVMSEKSQNSSYDGWDNDKVLIPAPLLRQDAPPSRQIYSENRISGLIYRPASVGGWEAAQRQVRAALARRHNFNPEDKGAIRLFDSIESAQMFDSIFTAGEIFLAVIALVTLSLGGVGVMNTMMMAVSERTNEIGLKKALGATNRRVLLDFFLEGAFLAVLSGGAGLLLVSALSALVNSLPLPAMFSGLPIKWNVLAGATFALGLVAVGSALPPARRAAAMSPVEALRHER